MARPAHGLALRAAEFRQARSASAITPPGDRRAAPLHLRGFSAAAAGPLPWQQARFDERCVELEAYRAKHGDCLVPQNFLSNPRLGRWVNTQRSAKKRLDGGDPNPGITQARVDQLTAVGMDWEGQRSFEERCA
eukprot:COSAG04_NODE_4013_length_2361_cov_2.376216_3_plen_133_part_01